MKIGIFQDLHANLPALKKAIEFFSVNNCDRIIHVGDLIGIGPYPIECLELAFSCPKIEFIMGNHDYLYPFGIPSPRPSYMSEEEVQHQNWTHTQINGAYKDEVRNWPFIKEIDLGNNRKASFQHYGIDEQIMEFKRHIMHPVVADLDQMFIERNSDIIFYGHNHIATDITGRSRYVNLGSAGCYHDPEVRLGILTVTDEALNLEKYSLPYDDDGLMEAFEEREVPAREFITKNFITRT